MVSLAAQRCRHWDRVPEDSVVETEEWGTEDRLGDFLEEGRQTYERKLDGLVAEGWHNCLVQSCQELGGWSLEMSLSFRACLYTGEFPHTHKEPEARAAGSSLRCLCLHLHRVWGACQASKKFLNDHPCRFRSFQISASLPSVNIDQLLFRKAPGRVRCTCPRGRHLDRAASRSSPRSSS